MMPCHFMEVVYMATKSILKDVRIRDKRLAKSFVDAISRTEQTTRERSDLKWKSTELTGDKIKEFFGKK